MERGMYSFYDFDEKKHYFYLLGLVEDDKMIIGYDGEIVAWVYQYGLERFLPTLEEGIKMLEQVPTQSVFVPHKLSRHLPYLHHLGNWQYDVLAPSHYRDFALTEDSFHEAGELHNLFYRFYSRHWWGKLPIEQRLSEMVKSFKGKLSDKTMARLARYLFDKHVNDENRLRLFLHGGIYQYLVQSDRNDGDN